jgi:hypothetical protein
MVEINQIKDKESILFLMLPWAWHTDKFAIPAICQRL